LYYVIKQNALMKYIGDGTTHEWKQINSVSDVTADLSKLDKRVETAEGKITALETTLGANDVTGSTAFGRIKELEGKMTTAEGEIDALQTLTGEQKTAIENLQKAVGDDAEGLASKVTGLEGRMDTVEGGIDTINGKIGTVESGKTVVGLIGEAVTTAAGDATSKADKALADAKTYAD
jgi:chromosome segregation ATPase